MPIATVNPTTGQTERTFERHTRAEVLARTDAAHSAHRKLRECSFTERAVWLRGAAALFEAEVTETARLLTVEMGKPINHSKADGGAAGWLPAVAGCSQCLAHGGVAEHGPGAHRNIRQ